MHMIRRKIWATATFCLAVAGAAHGQSGPAPKATLGNPGYIARGAAPAAAPGYPQYVPRNYVAPTPPTYAPPTPNLPTATPAMMTTEPVPPPAPLAVGQIPADDTVLFAADQDPKAPATVPLPTPMTTPMGKPMDPKVMPGSPMGTPMTTPMGTVPMGTVVEGGPVMNGPIVNGPINGGPIMDGCGSGTPFLDGCDGMPRAWASVEYINWKFRGAHIPALVTIAPAGAPGTLGDPGTAAVFGGDDRQSDWQGGFRVRGGTWLEGGTGIDVGFFWLGRVKDRFAVGSNGDRACSARSSTPRPGPRTPPWWPSSTRWPGRSCPGG